MPREEGVEVLLSGEGGDEIFCGYTYLKRFPAGTVDGQADRVLGLFAQQRVFAFGPDEPVQFGARGSAVDFRRVAGLRVADSAGVQAEAEGEGKIEKWIFRKAYESDLPESITWRGKQEFSQGSGSADVLPGYFEEPMDDQEFAAASASSIRWSAARKSATISAFSSSTSVRNGPWRPSGNGSACERGNASGRRSCSEHERRSKMRPQTEIGETLLRKLDWKHEESVSSLYRPLSDDDIRQIARRRIGSPGGVRNGRLLGHGIRGIPSRRGKRRHGQPHRATPAVAGRGRDRLQPVVDHALLARRRATIVVLEGDRVHYATGGTAIYVLDPDTGQRRPSTVEDVILNARMVDALENIHAFTINVFPNEIQEKDDIDVNRFFHALDNTTKHVMGGVYSLDGCQQVVRMAEMIAGGAGSTAGRSRSSRSSR